MISNLFRISPSPTFTLTVPQAGQLRGGLGQLTDGEKGETNFRLDPKRRGIKGYEWIGWKNDTFGQKPITMTFKFDTVRNFSKVRGYNDWMV